MSEVQNLQFQNMSDLVALKSFGFPSFSTSSVSGSKLARGTTNVSVYSC